MSTPTGSSSTSMVRARGRESATVCLNQTSLSYLSQHSFWIHESIFVCFPGEYAGFDESQPTAESGGKGKVISMLKEQYGFKTVVMIGDGATDLEASPPAVSVQIESQLFTVFGFMFDDLVVNPIVKRIGLRWTSCMEPFCFVTSVVQENVATLFYSEAPEMFCGLPSFTRFSIGMSV